jgi:hypothetical protein
VCTSFSLGVYDSAYRDKKVVVVSCFRAPLQWCDTFLAIFGLLPSDYMNTRPSTGRIARPEDSAPQLQGLKLRHESRFPS